MKTMKVDFEVPTIKAFPEIPVLINDSMVHSQPFKAKPQHQAPLGYPGELVADWHDKAIEKMAELLTKFRSLRVVHGYLCEMWGLY